jgi:hypothetical protein
LFIKFSWNFDISHDTHDTYGTCDRSSIGGDVHFHKSQSFTNIQNEPEIVFKKPVKRNLTKSDKRFIYLKRLFDEEDDDE